jgi:hypothetical protein
MIKKYFLFITLIATCQVFSKGVYRNLENNVNTDVCQTSFGKANLITSNFYINFNYLTLTNPFNQIRCHSFFSCFNHFSKNSNEIIQLEFIGSTTYLRKGRRA